MPNSQLDLKLMQGQPNHRTTQPHILFYLLVQSDFSVAAGSLWLAVPDALGGAATLQPVHPLTQQQQQQREQTIASDT
jgi:hypothetical protein